MSPFNRNLLLLLGGIAGVLLIAAGSTYLVKYKPWGVPDAVRGKYEAKLVAIDQRNQLVASWENRARPKVTCRSFYEVGGRRDQSSETFQFTVRNDGDLPLTLTVLKSSNESVCETPTEPIAPGQTEQITVSWFTGERPGPFEFTTTFASNDPLQESFEVKFRGRIKSKVVIPRTLAFPATNSSETAQTSFTVNSELWDAMEVIDIRTTEKLDWSAQVTETTDGTFASSVEVTLMKTFFDVGKYEVPATLVAKGETGEVIETPFKLVGKVNQPIIFQGPELHMTDGLDLGTVESNQEHAFHFNCKVNGDLSRKIEVLEVQPQELRAEIKEQSRPGNYRVSIIVPENCPLVVFNTTKQGFVKVGDPEDERFSNWLPIHGVVVPPSK